MFTSENDHKNDLNLFYYKDHICLIKDINKYLHRNNKDNNKKHFCVRCLNSFISEENLNKHKNLCIQSTILKAKNWFYLKKIVY